MTFALLLAFAYLLGAVPFGVLIARAQGVDLTKVGSGNIGATNVSRALGPAWALVVLTLDIGKGALPAIFAGRVLEDAGQLHSLGAGLAAVVGHCASPFLRFKGGKGIATGLGALLGSSPLAALCALGVFAAAFAVCKYVSLSSLVAALALPLLGWALQEPPAVVLAYATLFLYLLYRHRANIGRLARGEEPRFRFRAGRGAADSNAESADSAGLAPPAVESGKAGEPSLGGDGPKESQDRL